MLIFIQKKDIFNGHLILINRDHKIYNPEFKYQKYQGVYLETETMKNLLKLLAKIKSGNSIVMVSGLRSKTQQEKIYRESLETKGLEFTQKYVALPNTSEHQSGLAIDLGLNTDEIDFICPFFPDEDICLKFKQQAHKYGFIMRYPESKGLITKIAAEPWHFRYTGLPHSLIMKEKGMCLEEYIEFIKNYSQQNALKYDEYSVFYLPYKNDECYINLEDGINYNISGNNIDGVIVTLWR